MKKLTWCLVSAATVLLLAASCGEDDGNPSGTSGTGDTTGIPASQAALYAVGNWLEVLPPIGTALPDTLNVKLNVNTDTTYKLEIIDLPAKVLFSHAGTWTASGDTLYLHGSQCAAIDTTAEPDTLKPLTDATCATPIPLYMDIDTTLTPWKWTVKAADLGPAIDAFPVPADMKAIAMALTFFLEKQ